MSRPYERWGAKRVTHRTRLRGWTRHLRWKKPWRTVEPLWVDPCWPPQVVERESYIKQQNTLKKRRASA